MTAIIGIIAIIVVALVGWAIAEGKYKAIKYELNDQEQEVLSQGQKQLEQNGFKELNIGDVKRTIATTGYDAV